LTFSSKPDGTPKAQIVITRANAAAKKGAAAAAASPYLQSAQLNRLVAEPNLQEMLAQ